TSSVTGQAAVLGAAAVSRVPVSFLDVKVPPGVPDLGTIMLNATSQTITGPGSFSVGDITLYKDAKLYIDNSAGPVTLYVTGYISLYAGSDIKVTDPDPEKFAVYLANATG